MAFQLECWSCESVDKDGESGDKREELDEASQPSLKLEMGEKSTKLNLEDEKAKVGADNALVKMSATCSLEET